MKKLTIIAVAGAGLILSAVTSNAQLTYSGAVSDSTTLSATPTLGSSYANGILSGTVDEWVIAAGGDANNTYGGLTFVLQVNETGSDIVDQLSIDGFGGVTGSFGYSGADTVAYASAAAGPVQVDFASGYTGAGDYVYLYTSAPSDGGSIVNIQDSINTSAQILAPVPEASTVMAGALMVLPLGFGAFRALRKERMA
jgi:hypothetical protein